MSRRSNDVREHPTHHRGYDWKRLVWAVAVSVLGLLVDAVAIGLDTEDSLLLAVVKKALLAAGALAFVAGFLYAVLRELAHAFDRCPECRRIIRKTEIDYDRTYYPCRRCGITWTCPCRLSAD